MSFRPQEERIAPPATPITDVAITRFEHVFEVEPGLMTEHVVQQTFPNWDTLRIVRARHDHLEWMHRHWARVVVSGEGLLEEGSRGGETVG
jgi:hypothetical protein